MAESAGPSGSKKQAGSSGRRLWVMLGIVVVAGITFRSALALVFFVMMPAGAGGFWSNAGPIILLAVITGLGAFGTYKLARILKN